MAFISPLDLSFILSLTWTYLYANVEGDEHTIIYLYATKSSQFKDQLATWTSFTPSVTRQMVFQRSPYTSTVLGSEYTLVNKTLFALGESPDNGYEN